jgi:chromosome segregation ATPase
MRLTVELEDADMANIGGIYFWTQSDYNKLMAQLSALQSQMTSIQAGIRKLLIQENQQMSALDDLKAAVQQTQDIEQSATTLIQGIAQQLSDALANNTAASNDPALAALRDQLNSSAAELSAAITANTQAATNPPTDQPPQDPNAPQVNPLSGRHR